MNLAGIGKILIGLYSLTKEVWDEIKRERTKQKTLRTAKEQLMAKAREHQRAQEESAIRKVTVSTPEAERPRPPPRRR